MSAFGICDSVRIEAEATACEQCGSTSRVGRGLCLNCLLLRCLGSESENKSTLTGLLDEINVPDADWRIGNYQILEEIGRGGMGVIYRARQRHSRRIVALKRILSFQANSQETLARFRREAEAAASLDHPNILPIYEVSEGEDGLPFFSMKFAPGGSLLDAAPALRNDPRRSVELMAKVAHAVHYAHGHGILHRDLKPGNILLDGCGEPLVSDFGLAKWLDTTSDVTRTLTIFGTPGYIAPEQAQGPAKSLTPAADVYSLGALLFDLFTGRPPFLGEHALAVIQQASEKPAPKLRSLIPGFDRDLETICAKCLEREPNARYRSAGDLAEDLEHWLKHEPIRARRSGFFTHARKWVRRNPSTAMLVTVLLALAVGLSLIVWHRQPAVLLPKSVAVLPFENLSPDPDNAYFADGIQDEILTRLSKIADLKVISRTSTQTYKSAPRNLREIAQQLGVSNIVEGRVQRSADQVRVSVQLINAVTDSHLWAESYDRQFSDIFQVESDVAEKIAASLEARLTGREKSDISFVSTQNSQAYEAYLQARAVYREGTPDSLERAEQAVEKAVRLDPGFAAAWALLARMRAVAYSWGSHTETSRTAARKAAETAIRLQPDLAEAQMVKGFYEYWVMGDYDAARRTFEQVQSRWPNNADIVEALGLIAFRQGRWKEAREYFDAAIVLNPRELYLHLDAFYARASVRDFPAALRTIDQALAIWPDDTTLIGLKASVYQALGDLDRAGALLSRLRPKPVYSVAINAICDQAMLRRDPVAAVTLLRTLCDPANSLPPWLHAWFHVFLGRLEQLSGNPSEARTSFTEAREALEQLQQQTQDPSPLLAEALAGLGEQEAALQQADRVVASSAHDARSGPGYEELRARIQARFGDRDRAIPALKHLLETPYNGAVGPPLTPALLRLHPDFDPLRSDPAFQKLCEEKQP